MKRLKNTIGAGEFKAKCLQLIDQVSQKRFRLTITKRGRAVAALVPYDHEPPSLFGCMKESVNIDGDIIGGTGEKWEADD